MEWRIGALYCIYSADRPAGPFANHQRDEEAIFDETLGRVPASVLVSLKALSSIDGMSLPPIADIPAPFPRTIAVRKVVGVRGYYG